MEHDQCVTFYAEGMVKMRIVFPHGKVDCRHCRFCRFRDAFGIYQCGLTDDYIEKYELDQRSEHCPVEMAETPF